MTEPVKHMIPDAPLTPVGEAELEAKKAAEAKKVKEERRNKEKETVRKQVEDAAQAHVALGNKFKDEDREEAEKKAEVEAKKAEAEAKK